MKLDSSRYKLSNWKSNVLKSEDTKQKKSLNLEILHN